MQSVVATIKRAFWAIFLGLAIVSFPLPSLALTVHDVPNPQQVYGDWVTDMANLLDPETKATLNQIISNLEAKNGTEIAVVTVPDTAPADTPKQFATKLFNYWGIGKKNKNNGVLFLISRDDRRVEIDTGYGMEKILPNTQVSNIIHQLIIPHFKQGDFAGGTLAGIQALTKALAKHDILATTSSISSKKHQPSSQVLLVGLILVMLLILGVMIAWGIVQLIEADKGRAKSGSWSYSYRASSWRGGHRGSSWDGGDSGSSGGGDSGGSWGGGDSGSFGGGDSGGGGDGGSW